MAQETPSPSEAREYESKAEKIMTPEQVAMSRARENAVMLTPAMEGAGLSKEQTESVIDQAGEVAKKEFREREAQDPLGQIGAALESVAVNDKEREMARTSMSNVEATRQQQIEDIGRAKIKEGLEYDAEVSLDDININEFRNHVTGGEVDDKGMRELTLRPGRIRADAEEGWHDMVQGLLQKIGTLKAGQKIETLWSRPDLKSQEDWDFGTSKVAKRLRSGIPGVSVDVHVPGEHGDKRLAGIWGFTLRLDSEAASRSHGLKAK